MYSTFGIMGIPWSLMAFSILHIARRVAMSMKVFFNYLVGSHISKGGLLLYMVLSEMLPGAMPRPCVDSISGSWISDEARNLPSANTKRYLPRVQGRFLIPTRYEPLRNEPFWLWVYTWITENWPTWVSATSRRYRSKADDKPDIGKNDTVGRD